MFSTGQVWKFGRLGFRLDTFFAYFLEAIGPSMEEKMFANYNDSTMLTRYANNGSVEEGEYTRWIIKVSSYRGERVEQ